MNSEADFIAAIAASPNDELLLRAFADWLEEQGDRRAAWVRLRQVRAWMGPNFDDPIPKLIDALERRRDVIRVRKAAGLIGAPIVPELTALLGHKEPYVRKQAIWCLRRIGKPAAEAVPALLEALKDDAHDVRELAAKTLKEIRPKKGTDTSQLRAALTDSNYSVRTEAVAVLDGLGAKEDVAAQLAVQLDDPDVNVRRAAAVGLGNLRETAAPAVVGLVPLLGDPEEDVRREAALALGKIRAKEAIRPLCSSLRDASEAVRARAAEALGMIGDAAAAADLARRLQKDESARVRRECADALGRLKAKDETTLTALRAAEADEDQSVRPRRRRP